MSVRIIGTDGQEYEPIGYADRLNIGDYFINYLGEVVSTEAKVTLIGRAALLVKPVRKRHEAGGIVFEEAGEARLLKAGEWGLGTLNGNIIINTGQQTAFEYIPLVVVHD